MESTRLLVGDRDEIAYIIWVLLVSVSVLQAAFLLIWIKEPLQNMSFNLSGTIHAAYCKKSICWFILKHNFNIRLRN